MSYRGEGTMDRRRFLWDWIDEHHPEAFEDPGYLMLKAAGSRARAIRAVAQHFGITWQDTLLYRALARDVRHWLDDPDRFSPHVDEIALELAMGFNWDVIAALTQTEYGMFLDRLDAMRDPFDMDTEDRTTDGSAPRGGKRLVDASRRRLAYLKGSPRQRYRLVEALAKKRVQAAVVAA